MNLQLTKEDLLNWLKTRQQEYEILVPTKEPNEEYNWRTWNGKSLPDSEYKNTLKPAKDLFFPQHEVLLKYQKVKDEKTIVEAPDLPKQKRILFGMRPCDAQSLIILDKVFLGEEYQDPFYQARRENTLIISLVRQDPGQGCFCSQPLSNEGSDILLVELDGKYLLELVTPKGQEAFRDVEYSNAESSISLEMEQIKNKLGQEIAGGDLTGKLDLMFDSPLWQELQEKCLNCGVCAFLCPTCHCFDLTDNQKGKKIRSWDSCMYTGFTKQASGHNPRPSGIERLRQRIMHKFKYFPEKYGITACVGCGRCVERCPVNLDIRQVLLKIKGVL